MAKAKTQLTGFSRFLIFLIIAAPSIFFGVSYYKGEDPVQTLKSIFKSTNEAVEQVEVPQETAVVPETAVNSELAKLRDEKAFNEKRITELYRENETLKAQLKEKEAELLEIKSQLDKIKSAIGQ